MVTTVCPSLMRTGSPRNATFKGQHKKEYAWFSIGGSLPLAAMDVDAAARKIMRASQNGDGEVIIRNRGDVLNAAQSLAPELTRNLLGLANRLLPEMGGIGTRAAKGYESQSPWSPSWLTSLGDNAAVRNNEMRSHPVEPV